MKIAVTYENGEVFQHFGHSKQFKIYEVEEQQIKKTDIISVTGEGHGALAGFLKERGVTALICGGIGSGAGELLKKEGIAVYGGVSGSADKAVETFLTNTLDYDPAARCRHHDGKCGH